MNGMKQGQLFRRSDVFMMGYDGMNRCNGFIIRFVEENQDSSIQVRLIWGFILGESEIPKILVDFKA